MIRAYVFNFVMVSGKRCRVVFDRYGLNADQFDPDNVNQMTSNAIGSVIGAYPGDPIKTYTVTEID